MKRLCRDEIEQEIEETAMASRIWKLIVAPVEMPRWGWWLWFLASVTNLIIHLR
jgi:hypothetical protein